MSSTASQLPDIDCAIIGGGIAGLWLCNLLDARGYGTVLFEADALGCQQTLGSQGMIHGGLKYALGGALTGASEAIARMPERWRACLAGEGPVDLTGLTPLSDRYYMFAEGNSLGRLTSFFASRMLRGRIEHLQSADYPAGLAGFAGVVYALNDFVIDTPALLNRLLAPVQDRAYRLRMTASNLCRVDRGWQISVDGQRLLARRLILCAGSGNGPLAEALDLSGPAMQLRPLQQVIVRHPDLQALYAHCLTGITRSEPRLTITSHPDPDSGPGRWLWYLGGQLSTEGAGRPARQQIERARQELTRCVPWIDWSAGRFDCLTWHRAEPAQSGRARPDQAFVEALDQCLICWPTKLSLAPDLGDRVLALLPPPEAPGRPDLVVEQATVGHLPWAS